MQVGADRPIGDSAAVGIAAVAESRRFPCLGGFPCAAGALGDGTQTGPELGRTGCGQQVPPHPVRNLQWSRRAMPRPLSACGESLQAAGRSSAVFGSGCGRRRMESAAGAAPAPVRCCTTRASSRWTKPSFALRRSRSGGRDSQRSDGTKISVPWRAPIPCRSTEKGRQSRPASSTPTRTPPGTEPTT